MFDNHRNLKSKLILLTGLLIATACSHPNNPDLPKDAIDPSVVNNPTSAAQGADKKNVPVLNFETDKHDFGTITQGEKVSFAFNFKNVGNADLVIRAAQGSCGCTVPQYPKDPVKPGDGGVINVTFNSEGKEGQQEKTVTVISNTMPNTYVLTITGNVTKP